MKSDIDLLSEIRIASPCTASWDEMQGDDRVRFCQHCRLNVYNLSAVTRREAEALVKEKEGRLCVRLYRRRDGTALTADCPVGLRALRRALLARAGFITTAYAGVCSLALVLTSAGRQTLQNSWLGQSRPFKAPIRAEEPAEPVKAGTENPVDPRPASKWIPVRPEPVMGKLMVPDTSPMGVEMGQSMVPNASRTGAQFRAGRKRLTSSSQDGEKHQDPSPDR
jgi:hypothetical protein